MWGLSPVATRALVLQLPPLPVLVLRVMIAAVALLPLGIPLLRRFAWSSAPRMAAAGLLGMVGYNLPVTIGLAWVPASTAVLLLATEPIWILLMSRVFLAQRGPAWSWPGPGWPSWPGRACGRPAPAGPAGCWPGSAWSCWARRCSARTRSCCGR
jgi:drug/metabolite transporter (DMT)-like permease